MTQRFNPPPGWQVPAGFTPTPGWQPDPSWPAAPAGWNFWVDDSLAAGPYDGAAPGPDDGAAPGPYDGSAAGPYDTPAAQRNPYDASSLSDTARLELAERKADVGRRGIIVGLIICAVAVGINVAIYATSGDLSQPLGWAALILGAITVSRGLIRSAKVRKEVQALRSAIGDGRHGSDLGSSDRPGAGGSRKDDLYR